jgi:hypothetical protein
MASEFVFPAFVDMRFLFHFGTIPAFERDIEVVSIAFDDVADPVFTRFLPVEKLKKIHNFTPKF